MASVRGRSWVMHRAESFAWLLEQRAESFDALVTDPPYSSGGFTCDALADEERRIARSRRAAA